MTDDRALIGRLSGQIDQTLMGLLPPGVEVALVNFPNHENVGDPAVWLGTRASLRRLGVPVGYRAAWSTYDPIVLRRAVPEGPILLNGGGNFGDRHRGQQQTRERVLQDFPGRTVIQLPQSVDFAEVANIHRMRDLCARHGAVHLLLRDERSLAFAQEHFPDVPSERCPDMVFALGPLDRPTDADVDIVWQARSDIESSGVAPPDAPDVRVTDWVPPRAPDFVVPARIRLVRSLNLRLVDLMGTRHPLTRPLWRAAAATFDPLARYWLARGLRLLSTGRVVVTDRLHGHVLCLLAGIPNVVLDNDNGKVRALFETDTSASGISHWADDPAEALSLARTLVAAS